MAISSVNKNILSSLLPQIVNIASNLILPALIISTFGSQINGLISSTKSIVGYISLVGAGIAVSTTQALYNPVATNNTTEVRGLLKATSQLFNRVGVIYVIITIIVALLYPYFIDSNIEYTTTCFLVIVIGISGASEFFAVGTCRSLLFADRRTYICTSIQALSLLVSLICAIILLKVGANIIWVQLSISIVYILRAFLLKFYVTKHYPQYDYSLPEVTPIKTAVEKRGDAMIHQLSGLAVWSTQTIILSLMVGLDAASIYAVYNIIFSGLQSICSNINNAVTPFIGRSLATESIDISIQKYDKIEYGFHIMSTIIYAVTAIMIIPFISIYTQNADINYIYREYALILVCIHILNIKRLPNNALINAAGHFKETRNRALIEATICITGSLIFTIFFGMYGVLIGTLCAIGWRSFDIIIYSNRHILKQSCKRSLFRLFRTFLIIIILYMLCRDLAYTEPKSYLTWINSSIYCSLISIILVIIDSMLFDRKSSMYLFKYLIKRNGHIRV